MSNQTDKIVKTYKLLAGIPNLIGAQLLNNATVVSSVWTQRNVERGKVSKFTRNHFLTSELACKSETLPFDITNETLASTSNSGNYRALIREVDDKDGHKQHLEVWNNGNLQNCTNLASLELHGDVYTDGEFGVLEWSPDDKKLLYVAEKKEPKTESFLKRKVVKEETTKESEPIKGEQYLFKQDWGEQLVNKKQSVLVEYDISNDCFKILEGIPENVCPMQPTWSPNGLYIVGVAFKMEPRKLGLVFCTNRPNAMFTVDFNGVYEEISTEGKSVRSPKFTPDGKTLVWLQRNTNGPHHSCMALVKKDVPLKNSKIQTVVDIVETEIPIAEGRSFHGLYNVTFPKRCWASNNRLLLTTYQKYRLNAYVININSGVTMELQYPSDSQMVLDVCDDIVLINRKNALVPDKLAIGCLPGVGQENHIIFKELTRPPKLEYADSYVCNYMDLKYESNDDVVNTFSAIYVGPKMGEEKSFPLIVWPHGGPHSAFSNNFSLELGLYNAFGLAVLLVNYRGSTGAGQASVEFLLGKIGKSDVSDCMLATEQALKQFPWLDPNRLILTGGSHGGFLVTHLSGQYPDMFKVVVARNPVIDVASLSIISDIPDWSFVECDLLYTQVGQPNADILVAMRKASPIQHAHKVRAPTLLQVGIKDLRVPPAQSIEYYHRLKANGKKVRMNIYEDNHSISTVNNEVDNLINALLWIQQHIEI